MRLQVTAYPSDAQPCPFVPKVDGPAWLVVADLGQRDRAGWLDIEGVALVAAEAVGGGELDVELAEVAVAGGAAEALAGGVEAQPVGQWAAVAEAGAVAEGVVAAGGIAGDGGWGIGVDKAVGVRLVLKREAGDGAAVEQWQAGNRGDWLDDVVYPQAELGLGGTGTTVGCGDGELVAALGVEVRCGVEGAAAGVEADPVGQVAAVAALEAVAEGVAIGVGEGGVEVEAEGVASG